jgi:hypothetical protein
VTLEELDIALEELELRVERLRALYEQYFLGFEKIEPNVARKDVERRIYVLRREKIRNTGKRFKLQTIIQRYNTFQMYWQRVCREIENGTYKRHVLRAERQLAPGQQLTIAARRRFGKLIAAGAGEGLTNAATAAEAEAQRPSDAPPESSDGETRRPLPPRQSELRDAATPFEEEAPTQARRAPPPKPTRQRPLSSQPPQDAAKFDSLELDMGFLGSWVPPAPKAAPQVQPAAPVASAPREPFEKSKSAPSAAPPPKPRSSPRAAPPPKPKSSPRAAPPPKPAAASSGLSDQRVRDLHEKLVALKRENNEAGQVSFENLSRSLRETESKLRAQHKDRNIDFDVVIRDGKAIVKPKVK